MKVRISSIILLLCYFILSNSVTINLLNGVSLSNYYTLVPNTQYIWNMTFSAINIPSSSVFQLQFDSRYNIDSSTLTNCQYSLSNSAPYNPTGCSVIYSSTNQNYQVTFNSIFTSPLTSQTVLNIIFNITNPYCGSEVTQYINIYIYDPSSNQIGVGVASIIYTASLMSNCTYTSSSTLTGAVSTRTISFIPSVVVLSGSTISIDLPMWFVSTSTSNFPSLSISCTGVTNSDSPSPSCSFGQYTDQNSNPYQQISISGVFASDRSFSSPVVLTISFMKNPPSLAPFGPISFVIMYNSVSSQTCKDIYHSNTAMNTPSSISTGLLNPLTISTAYNGKSIRLGVRQPFPAATGQLVLSFPSSLQVTYAATSYPLTTTSNGNTTIMTFSSLSGSDVTAGNIGVSSINFITPPSSRSFTITLMDQLVQNGTVYGIDSQSISYTCQNGAITSAAVTASSYNVNAAVQYNLVFKTFNNLISGSSIYIYFPSVVTPRGGSPCSTNTSFISCAVQNSTTAILSLTGLISGNTTIAVNFQNVTNPNQAITTSSFQIYTYYDSGMDSLVDRVTTGITLTTVPNPILTATASVTPSSFVTYALTSYTISFTLSDSIPAFGYITINFPPTITFGTVALVNASFVTTFCSLSASNNVATLSNCFPSGMSNLNLSIQLSGIYNPPSKQPTSSFSLFTYGPNGQVNNITSGVIVTMTTPATSTAFSVSPLSPVVHSFVQYNIGFTFAVPHQIGDYFIFNIPNQMSFSVTPTCNGISGNASVTCAVINVTSIQVTIASIPLSTVQISISTIRNYDVATSISFQAYLYNSGNYAMQTTPLGSVTFTPTALTSITINNDNQIALYQNSNITMLVNTPFAMNNLFLSNLTSLVIIPPPQISIISNSTCQPSSGSCVFSNNSAVITGVGLSLTSFSIVLKNLVLPYFTVSSNSFTVNYLYNNMQVAIVSSGVVILPFCTSPCERCNPSQTICKSCLPSPNTAIYLYNVNNSCLNTCPNGYYPDSGNNCKTCNPPCLWCTDSANCTSCISNTFLFQKTCLNPCPATYFGNSSLICESCQLPCFNCTSNSTCLSCAVNFYTNFSCVNASSCPSGTYGNTTTNTCASCNPPCANCWQSATNCTSCASGYVYYSNGCPLTCPNTYYNSSNFCLTCMPPCGNCTALNFCLSCLSDYLSAGGCVPAANCPTGTFPNNATNNCQTCAVGCSVCSSSSSCSACTTNFLFYNLQCLLSCPNTTYQSGTTCINCGSNCLGCLGNANTCTSCTSPLLLQSSSCVSNCSIGSYSNGVSCLICLTSCQTCTTGTTCSSCPTGTYLSSGQCQSNCPSGTYQDSLTNNCSTCSTTCLTCSSFTSCNSCISPLVMYQNTCNGSCPANYFSVNGNCVTCSFCSSCISSVSCSVCLPGYYMLNNVCYSTCPLTSIPDVSTMTCGPCDSACRTCSGSSTNCLSCSGGLYLLNGVCSSSCPSGYIQQSGSCIISNIGNIIYFPLSITFLVIFIIVAYSKYNHTKTEMVTSLCGVLGLLVWISWVVLVFQAYSTDLNLSQSVKTILVGVGIIGIALSVIFGVIFMIWFRNYFKADNGFNQWVWHTDNNLNTYKIIFVFTLFSFAFFRLIYCRLFGRINFCAFFLKGGQLLLASYKFAFLQVILCIFPLVFVSAYIIFIKQQYDQTLINAIDSLLLSICMIVLLIIDTATKDESFFDQMIEDQPYLKNVKYNELNHSQSSIRDFSDIENIRRQKTELDYRQKEDFFRKKINFLDNINKFGHLNALLPEPIASERRIKSLPNEIQNLPQFDIDGNSLNQDQIKVIDDDFFLNEQERAKEREEAERLRLLQEERKKRQKEKADAEAEAEEERLRRQKLIDEDKDQQQSIQFPDLAAIQKVENKGLNMKNSPIHILNNFKKVEDRQINEKAKKKLQQLAKKNGLDPEFMKQTFGVQKNHNPELLNSIIDIHNHVNRQSVKALFSKQSNPQILQQLFSKTSTLSPEKLRQLLNDPKAQQIIKNLIDSQEGIMAPQIVKQLLDSNSKFSKQFVHSLLTGESGMDANKIKELLRDQPDKAARQASLKAMKKIGGDKLQNKQLLNNMLGEQSLLDATNFNRVANDLPKSVVDQLFKQKSKRNDIIISKVLNNKKIDLKNLSPILQDPELLNELALALSLGDPNIEENLINLFMNGESLDPQLLKEFLKNPTIMQKLAKQPVDPAFLTNLLKKQAKTDLSLLQKALQNMSNERITDIFSFKPEKNIDFQKISKLFQYNQKTDPELISKLLTPDIINNVFSKSSATKAEILSKLVQKGKKIDANEIIKIYGDDSKGGNYNRQNSKIENFDMDKKYNITDNNFNLNKNDGDSDMGDGFNKGVNQLLMSRTDGRMMGFLSPIQVGLQKSRKYGNNQNGNGGRHNRRGNNNQIDDISDENITQYNEGQLKQREDDDQEYQEIQQGGKKHKRKLKKKPLDDIRLPSQHIYLQRLEAPHELKKKNLRKKKKKVSSSMQQLEPMDEDNEIYDLDF